MSKETQLITVPTFVFSQGNSYDGVENPIHVDFYQDNIITLRQDGSYDKQEEINISSKAFEALVKAIRKHKIEAESYLK